MLNIDQILLHHYIRSHISNDLLSFKISHPSLGFIMGFPVVKEMKGCQMRRVEEEYNVKPDGGIWVQGEEGKYEIGGRSKVTEGGRRY